MNFTSLLRHPITIEEQIIESDDIGGQIQTWKEFASVRAEVKALSENAVGEVFTSMQIMDASLYRFRIRFIKGLKNNMRVIYDNRYFQIKRIVNQNQLNIISIIITQESL
jgi:SPP1 family predicted phage head-tail adaptor